MPTITANTKMVGSLSNKMAMPANCPVFVRVSVPRPGVSGSYGAAAGAYNGSVYVVGGDSTPTAAVSISANSASACSAGIRSRSESFTSGSTTSRPSLF